MATQEICRVIGNDEVGAGLFALTMEAPVLCLQAQPGQFVHITCSEGNLLRRPISICNVEGDQMTLVFQVKGAGTKWLAGRRAGDVLDVLGTLGHGFRMQELGARPIFIGGGIGVPPMLMTMRVAREMGAQPAAILGFRSRPAVILENAFRAIGETYVCTDDGSYGQHGFVTDVLKTQIAGATAVCACGPKPMLRAVSQIAEAQGVPCQVSMEERMGCGIGACLVCACELKLKDGQEGVRYGHVCKDGPVFDSKEVVW